MSSLSTLLMGCGTLDVFRSSVRRYSTIIYQTVWIVANCLTLVLGCGLDWFSHMNGQPTISGLADWTCRVWQALFAVVKYVGGWTIVAMLVERYLTTRRPQLARDYCSACFVKVGTTCMSHSSLTRHFFVVCLSLIHNKCVGRRTEGTKRTLAASRHR